MTIPRMSLCLRPAGAVALALGCLAGTGAAQSTPPPAATRARVPVDPATGLPPGMPDFRGVYTNRWIVNMADGRFVEKTVEVPFTEKGRAVYKQRAESFQKDDPNMTCQPSGLPRAGGTPYPMKIMQTADEVVLLWEGGLHLPHHPHRWTGAQARSVDLVRRLRWTLGRRHARGRRHRLQRQELARFVRLSARRETASRGAVPED